MGVKNNNYCVIMAGGIGSRFWPYSRTACPKQFLDILGLGSTLLQQTYSRFARIMPHENILIVTNAEYKEIVQKQLPQIPVDNILLEPARRNTAPCIAYAYSKIASRTTDANIVVAPSDHLIIREDEFLDIVQESLDLVSKNDILMTLGIKPSRPETGYGYIQIEKDSNKKIGNTNKVKTFTEKPNYDLACMFLESGDFYWNSGIFFWSLKSISNAFEKHLPELFNLFSNGHDLYGTKNEKEFISKIYPQCESISIDYGVMEKSDNVYVMLSNFGWSDLGTWGSMLENSEKDSNGNYISGENIFPYQVKNSIVKNETSKCMVVNGVEDFIVVNTEDVLLICRLKDEQMIKQFVADVKMKYGEKYF